VPRAVFWIIAFNGLLVSVERTLSFAAKLRFERVYRNHTELS